MTASHGTEGSASGTARRARVVVLGEFSAGKSTFINLVTGGRTLRTQVTATQMPAVWMSYGTGSARRVDLDGTETPVDLKKPGSVSVEDTAYIRAFMRTPVLELCDLIDTPGNSDPNIAPIAWERIAEIADVAVWLSSSTQAWRQSEAAAWAEMPERLRENSVLLLTRADKLTTDADRAKVLRRVTAEAGHLFGSVHMASLLDMASVQPVFREVVGLCREVNAAETPGAIDTAHILRSMAAAGAARAEEPAPDLPKPRPAPLPKMTPSPAPAPAPKPVSEADRDAEFTFAEAEAKRVPRPAAPVAPAPAPTARPGHASALWAQMIEGMPEGDPAMRERAFARFLSRLDRDIEKIESGEPALGRTG